MTSSTRPLVALTPIDSSALGAVGYDAASMTLAVKFKNSNTIHHYGDFTPKKWEDMQAADSMGSFFASKVRNNHPHSILEVEDE